MKICKCAQALAGTALVLVAIDSFSQTTVLHSFANNPDGAYPLGLAMLGNTLYGTASEGGSGWGTMFSVNTDGTAFTVLHTFTLMQNAGGAVPFAGLLASRGTFYGTTTYGGLNGFGTVFSVNSNGTFAVLYNFTGGQTGDTPLGTLTLSGDTLYGTTQYGGAYINQYGGAYGTVFSVKVDGTAFTLLHSFTDLSSTAPYANPDGAEPYGGLAVLGNTLYGTTVLGGGGGRGTVFAINTDGTGFTVLHTFTPAGSTAPFINTDGASPETALILAGNTLYGTAAAGGRFGAGTVFAINPDGTGFKVLHEFGHGDGAYPIGIIGHQTLRGDGWRHAVRHQHQRHRLLSATLRLTPQSDWEHGCIQQHTLWDFSKWRRERSRHSV